MLAVRGILLSLASALVFAGTWVAYHTIDDGLSAQMMGFEREPAQGWGYWKWHFIKRNMWGILGTVAILLGFAAMVFWGWLALVRDVRRR
jgi:hypothetical protein